VSRSWKVPVGLTHYTVREVKKLLDEKGEKLQGLCEFDKKRITISAEGSEGSQILTFWHEYLHAATHELGYDEQCDSETFIDSVSSSIARAIMHAPERYVRKPKGES
jgi:hypothetical protein